MYSGMQTPWLSHGTVSDTARSNDVSATPPTSYPAMSRLAIG